MDIEFHSCRIEICDFDTVRWDFPLHHVVCDTVTWHHQHSSGKEQWPFVDLFTTYQPLVPFVPLSQLKLNMLKAAKATESDISPEKVEGKKKVGIRSQRSQKEFVPINMLAYKLAELSPHHKQCLA